MNYSDMEKNNLGPIVTAYNRMAAYPDHRCLSSCDLARKTIMVYRTQQSDNGFLGVHEVEVNLCPLENLYAIKRFIDSQCSMMDLKKVDPKSIREHLKAQQLLAKEIEHRIASNRNADIAMLRCLIASKEAELSALRAILSTQESQLNKID